MHLKPVTILGSTHLGITIVNLHSRLALTHSPTDSSLVLALFDLLPRSR